MWLGIFAAMGVVIYLLTYPWRRAFQNAYRERYNTLLTPEELQQKDGFEWLGFEEMKKVRRIEWQRVDDPEVEARRRRVMISNGLIALCWVGAMIGWMFAA